MEECLHMSDPRNIFSVLSDKAQSQIGSGEEHWTKSRLTCGWLLFCPESSCVSLNWSFKAFEAGTINRLDVTPQLSRPRNLLWDESSFQPEYPFSKSVLSSRVRKKCKFIAMTSIEPRPDVRKRKNKGWHHYLIQAEQVDSPWEPAVCSRGLEHYVEKNLKESWAQGREFPDPWMMSAMVEEGEGTQCFCYPCS